MRSNHIKEKLAQGQTVFGVWLGLPGTFALRLIARAGYDWVMIDTEHAPIDQTLMAQMVGVVADSGKAAPFVRVPSNSVENIKRALDSGAWGVMVPMVNSRQEAEAVIQAAKYPPEGGRSIGGAYAALGFEASRAEYAGQANRQVMVGIQLESKEAVENCEDILSLPGIDLALIGPNDLHASLGLTPRSESDEPLFVEALRRIKEVAGRYKVPLGIFASDGQAAAARVREGFQFISVTTDLAALEKGLELNLSAARQAPARVSGSNSY